MISNQIIQNCIDDVHNISKLDFLVTDSFGNIIAQTDVNDSIEKGTLLSFMQSAAEVQEMKGQLLFKINDERQVSHILKVSGEGEAFLVGKLTGTQLEALIVAAFLLSRSARTAFTKPLKWLRNSLTNRTAISLPAWMKTISP